MAKTVVGLFDDPEEARRVAEELVDGGFPRSEIGVIANNTSDQFSTGTVAGDAGYHHTGESAAKGAGTGAVVGGIAGLLIGFGAFVIPGIGPIVAAGPIAAALTGAGMGAVAGGLLGALTNLGVPENEAHYYAEGVRRGGALVTVRTDDASADRAAAIFHRHDAVDIDERGTHYQETGFTGYNPSALPLAGEEMAAERNRWANAAPNRVDDMATIPVVEEELATGKRDVQREGARVYTHVAERPVEENATLDRVAVNKPFGNIDNVAFQGGVIELTETAEEAVVGKQARVVEEVTISKSAIDRTETVRDSVRRQDVDVEELNDGATLAEDAGLTRVRDAGGAFNV